MLEVVLSDLFSADKFMPHGHCFLWRPDILWLNVGSDAVIAIAYFMIPVLLFIFYFRRKDLKFSWLLVLFSLFILGCGSTHLADIWTTWRPHYGVAGGLKLFTAVVSVMTAVALWRVMPKILALPTARQMAEANARLQEEVAVRIAAEEGWRLAKEAADSANAAKTAFLANVSHEIRTPLGAVIGFAELLKSPEVSSEKKKDVHSAIKRNSDLLLTVVNDILDLSKIEAGKIQINKEPVRLGDILADLETSLQLQSNEKGIGFHLEMASDLPEVVWTDSTRLRQILLNLLGNAVKFTEKGEVHFNVRRIERGNQSPLISFTVIDTGIGIVAEKTQKLFEPFQQADDSTSRRYGGTGLGLALSRRLARALGGDVQLTSSQPGQGTIFTITIDSGLSQIQALTATSVKPACKLGPCRGRLDHRRVLLVDDSQDNLFLVTNFLQGAGAEVIAVGGGKEAIVQVERGGFDVIVMDLQMPGIDGFMATQEIRRRGYQGPVIALTAHGFSEVKERCFAHGLDDHVLKPVDPDELVRVLLKYCQRFRSPGLCGITESACEKSETDVQNRRDGEETFMVKVDQTDLDAM